MLNLVLDSVLKVYILPVGNGINLSLHMTNLPEAAKMQKERRCLLKRIFSLFASILVDFYIKF